MKEYVIEKEKKFYIHPVYKKYAANKNGEIMNVRLRKPWKGNINNGGYLQIGIYTSENKQKTYYSHRFIYECFNGMIEKDKFINHINFIRTDNRLKNLEIVTRSENNKKSAKNRDYSFVKDNHKKRKTVKAINLETKEEKIYKSLHAVKKDLSINEGQVKMICEGLNYCKTATCKKNGKRYTFEYLIPL